MPRRQNPQTKTSLLDAASTVIRAKGYSATTVDDICAAAGTSKGAFFHYFASKEALAVAAAGYWSEMTGGLFQGASYHQADDPLERLLGYLDFRIQLIRGALSEFTCLVGTMTQEAYGNPVIQKACRDSMFGHADTLVADIEAAKAKYGVTRKFTAEGLALHTQAVIQGAFILAKASGDPQCAVESLTHLKRYLKLLFSEANGSDEM